MINRILKTSIMIASMLFLSFNQVQANGFQIQEQGIRAMGMGNAFTAVADDASAMWYNPAGMAFMDGNDFMLGAVGVVVPKVAFTSNSSNTMLGAGKTGNNDRKNFVIPHFHATFTDPKTDVSYGLSITSPFGLESDWTYSPMGATTFPASVKSTTFSRVELFNVNPNIAFKITDHLSIGGGVDYVYVKDVDFNTSLLSQNADGDGWGGNISLMYKNDLFSVGVTYRTQVAIRVTGIANVTAGGTATATSSMKLPDMVNGGIAVHPTDTLTISAEADWTNWSKFDQLVFNYGSALSLVPGKLPPITSSVTPEEWHPTVAARVGVEWKARDDLRIRFGYTFDPSPVNAKNFSPGLPFEDRHLFSLGAGYDVTKAITVDVAYMYLKQKDINQTVSTGPAKLGNPQAIRNGRYKADAHLAGLSMNYHF